MKRYEVICALLVVMVSLTALIWKGCSQPPSEEELKEMGPSWIIYSPERIKHAVEDCDCEVLMHSDCEYEPVPSWNECEAFERRVREECGCDDSPADDARPQ